jgi:hypothetical protein
MQASRTYTCIARQSVTWLFTNVFCIGYRTWDGACVRRRILLVARAWNQYGRISFVLSDFGLQVRPVFLLLIMEATFFFDILFFVDRNHGIEAKYYADGEKYDFHVLSY